MKSEQQIKALAELDGYECCCKDGLWDDTHGNWNCEVHACRVDYLSSYDAIITLIQKHWETCCESSVRTKFEVCATPDQLCEALLRATGKWFDEQAAINSGNMMDM